MDKPLQDMIKWALDRIRAWAGPYQTGPGGFCLDDVVWDYPPAMPEMLTEASAKLAMEASHGIGFICGVAAGMDVTPLELLWNLGIDTEAPLVVIEAQPAPPRLAEGAVSGKRRRKRAMFPTVKSKPVKPAADARVRLTDTLGNQRYIYQTKRGEWVCESATGMPLAFSYAGIRLSVECKFALQDCKTADDVLAVLKRFSTGHTIEAV